FGTLGMMAESLCPLPQLQPQLEAAGSDLVAAAGMVGTPVGAARQARSTQQRTLKGGCSGGASLPLPEHDKPEDQQHRQLQQAQGSGNSQSLTQIGGGGDGDGGCDCGDGQGSGYLTSAWRQTTQSGVRHTTEAESTAAAMAASLEESNQRFFRLPGAAQVGGPGLVSSVSDGALAAYLGPTSSLIIGEANWSVSQQGLLAAAALSASAGALTLSEAMNGLGGGAEGGEAGPASLGIPTYSTYTTGGVSSEDVSVCGGGK
ncbi:hypothetical protein Vafri_10764, partial [Volvox africanus]